MPGFSKPPFIFHFIFLDNTSLRQPPPSPPMINVVRKYLREFLGTSFGVVNLLIYYNVE